MTSIAWDYLSDIEKAQLLHFRPDLLEDYKARLPLEEDEGQVFNPLRQVKIRRGK